MIRILKKSKWYLLTTLIFTGGIYYYFNVHSSNATEEATSFYVVETVERGEVTSGIETTGDIIAAEKLDIDVYKQTSRIDVVNVANGSHVEAGDVLVSFDKSDAYVDTESARVSVAEAELALQEEQANAADPSTEIRSKENQIAGYKKTIADAEQDIKEAYRDFLNADLTVESGNSKTEGKTRPALSGLYTKDVEDEYRIQIDLPDYNNRIHVESGFIYKVFDSDGEISEHEVIYGIATSIADTGLKITFTEASQLEEGDKWTITIPNTVTSEYVENLEHYKETIANLEKTITDTEVSLVNAGQELDDLYQTDTETYRNLNVEKAETTLAEAKQRLSQNYDVVQERDIIAPFAGTVEGMDNVVVGATPTGGSEDSINLGTLISDEFLTTFALGATDVAKIEVGQKVKVTVTSFTEQPVFDAYVTQISSLPESSGVAQYEVQALLDYDRPTAEIILREGMLADIEVVEEENEDALRIPTAAVTYEQGTPKVTVVDDLSEEQKQQAARMGIVRTGRTTLATYDVEVELGIVGQYYIEILGGLSEGDVIVSSSLTDTTADESVVEQSGFGPGSGGGRPGGSGEGSPPGG